MYKYVLYIRNILDNIYLTVVQIINLQIKIYDIIGIYIDMWKCATR